MAQKFVIINDKIVLGKVELHEELAQKDEIINFGGGDWHMIDKDTIQFTGFSYGFGKYNYQQLGDIIEKSKNIFRYPNRNISDKYNFICNNT